MNAKGGMTHFPARYMYLPPAQIMRSPVMNKDSSEARNSVAFATSCGVPFRLSGVPSSRPRGVPSDFELTMPCGTPPPSGYHSGLRRAIDLPVVAYVRRHGQRLHAKPRAFPGNLIELVVHLPCHRDDIGPFAGKSQRDGPADVAARACDQRRLSPKSHGILP
jgi:hypothetical protein